jgi:5-methylcytosine-specific restriction endonuclease McrA
MNPQDYLMNRWNIPAWLEREILLRDKCCVYCNAVFDAAIRPSWEHIVNDARIVTRENISLCCRACNSSKGVKPLATWLESAYCKRRGISVETVAEVVKKVLVNPPCFTVGLIEEPKAQS